MMPGVVHEHIQAAEALDGRVDHRADLRRVAQVAGDRLGLRAQLAHQLG